MSQNIYKQRFRDEWLKDKLFKDWLVKKSNFQGDFPECKFCRCIVSKSNRLSDLKVHAKSKKHIKNSEILAPCRQKVIQFAKTKANKTKSAEAYTSLYIAEHCSVLSVNHLEKLMKRISNCDFISNMQLKRTKCSCIIKNVLSPHFKNTLQKDIGDTKFSLLLDESTDISVIKYLGMVVIYFRKVDKKIETTFLKLAPLEECTANGIVSVIKSSLNEFGLNINNLMGIGTDNASVMTGINNGVYAKLKQDVPGLILIRCVCHSIQLATSIAAEETLPKSLEFMLSGTYNWFSISSSRQVQYRKLYSAINDGHDPLKIVRACQTRWLSIHSATQRILQQWLELKTHFQLNRNNYTAELLFNIYNEEINLAFLLFLNPILEELQRVNKAFEAKNSNPFKLFKDLIFLISSLVSKVVVARGDIDPLIISIADNLDPKPYLGFKFEQKITELLRNKSITQDDEKDVRQRCVNFIQKLIQQLRMRLPDNIEIFKSTEMLSVENTLKVPKKSLQPLLTLLGISDELITVIETQWNNIQYSKWSNVDDTVVFWAEVNDYKDATDTNPFKELCEFVFSVLSLPYSNAEVERVFSVMNQVKSKLRNRMKTDMVNSILTIRAGLKRNNCTCYDYELPGNIIDMVGTMHTYNNTEDIDDVIEIDF